MCTPTGPIDTCSFALSARYSDIPRHLEMVATVLEHVPRRDEVLVGLSEALANAIVHGALGVSSELRDKGGLESYLAAIELREARLGSMRTVFVTVRRFEERTEISVTDRGLGFAWQAQLHRPGRGLALLRRAFDRVRWNETGNSVTLTLLNEPTGA